MALADLEQRARRAGSVVELSFIMLNETHAVVPYRQAILWTDEDGVRALSGVAQVEREAPFTLWLSYLCRRLLNERGRSPAVVDAGILPPDESREWADWLPASLLSIPLIAPGPTGAAVPAGGLLLFARDDPWQDGEVALLTRAAETFALAWAWHHRPSAGALVRRGLARGWRVRGLRLAALLAVIAIGAIPLRLSVLAPGEVVARAPAVIRSPIEGVVERVAVQPNQIVAENALLFELDTTSIRGRLEVAQKALATSRAEYEQVAQQAFFDTRAKAQLAVVAGRIAERQAELAYYQELLGRSSVRAPAPGVVLVDDPTEWAGRPVAVGERVMAVADENEIELEAWLAPGDVIPLADDAPVTMFLNVDPLEPVRGRLRYLSYEAMPRPDETWAYRLRAGLVDTGGTAAGRPRLGLKGVVRVDGARVPLVYWLFRRPWAVIRQTFGW